MSNLAYIENFRLMSLTFLNRPVSTYVDVFDLCRSRVDLYRNPDLWRLDSTYVEFFYLCQNLLTYVTMPDISRLLCDLCQAAQLMP